MRVLYCKLQNAGSYRKKKYSSGYICPYNKGDCQYIDSLSMTKTIMCNNCENFLLKELAENVMEISLLTKIRH